MKKFFLTGIIIVAIIVVAFIAGKIYFKNKSVVPEGVDKFATLITQSDVDSLGIKDTVKYQGSVQVSGDPMIEEMEGFVHIYKFNNWVIEVQEYLKPGKRFAQWNAEDYGPFAVKIKNYTIYVTVMVDGFSSEQLRSLVNLVAKRLNNL